MVNITVSGKINEIKFLRERYGLGLKETKDIVEAIAEKQEKTAVLDELRRVVVDAIWRAIDKGLPRQSVQDELSSLGYRAVDGDLPNKF